MAHEIIHLWMTRGRTALETHLTTFAFLKLDTRLESVAANHVTWLAKRHDVAVILAQLPSASDTFEFATLLRYYVRKLPLCEELQLCKIFLSLYHS